MIDIRELLKKNKYILLVAVLLTGFAAYMMSITHSALWFDEAIEYFYSKTVEGGVPDGLTSTNMYERICSTFQPPLYNVLMHVWLSLFDYGDFSFRLAGVIVTLVGAVGMYKCIDDLCGTAYAAMGTMLYVFSASVAYYALECAEYNLMLCCISWTLYFFAKCIKEKSRVSFVGFFLFACLSVYSQYGAAFPVIALYLVLLANCVKDKKSLKTLLAGSGIVALIAALPLICFFLIPQIQNQGTSSVSHMPVFTRNLFIDYVKGVVMTLESNFVANFVTNGAGGHLRLVPLLIVYAAVIAAIIAFFGKSREYFRWVVVCVITYSLYFIAVACSFYGYKDWDGSLGCFNFGGRYCLFFVPVIVVTLVYGLSEFMKIIKNANFRKVMSVLIIMAAAVFCLAEMYVLHIGWEKDDVRGACQAWYDNRGYESVTLVHSRSNPNFQFYLTHNKDYDEEKQDNIVATDSWIEDADHDEIAQKFDEMGVFEHDAMYYVGPCYGTHIDNYERVKRVYEEHGFTVKILYDNLSVLLYVEKTSSSN